MPLYSASLDGFIQTDGMIDVITDTTSTFTVGYDTVNALTYLGMMRFPVSIPMGATIDQAQLKIVLATQPAVSSYISAKVHNAQNPDWPTEAYYIMFAPSFAAEDSVYVDTSLTAGTVVIIDITSPLQQLVDAYSITYFQVYLEQYGDDAQDYFAAIEHATLAEPKVDITSTSLGGGSTYNETMSGGVKVWGLASAKPEVINQTTSGGVLSAGTSSINAITSRTPSGGTLAAGTATNTYKAILAASGGVLMGGSAVEGIRVPVTYNETASGGVLAAGSVRISERPSVSGGTVINGTADVFKLTRLTASGGSLAGSTADRSYNFNPVLSGGVLAGGSSQGFTPSDEFAYGGAVVAGDAVNFVRIRSLTVTGGTRAGGSADIFVLKNPAISGGVKCGSTNTRYGKAKQYFFAVPRHKVQSDISRFELPVKIDTIGSPVLVRDDEGRELPFKVKDYDGTTSWFDVTTPLKELEDNLFELVTMD